VVKQDKPVRAVSSLSWHPSSNQLLIMTFNGQVMPCKVSSLLLDSSDSLMFCCFVFPLFTNYNALQNCLSPLPPSHTHVCRRACGRMWFRPSCHPPTCLWSRLAACKQLKRVRVRHALLLALFLFCLRV
jgi:hypothetical protein